MTLLRHFSVGRAGKLPHLMMLMDRLLEQVSQVPLTRKLQNEYFDLVNGVTEDTRGWLTEV